jgi:DNA (cytosine-5)-methyltransferase 1
MSKAVADKLKRLRGGAAPRLLDLFSGCGGFTLGFQRAGCHPVGGVEVDADAAESYAWNFHQSDPQWKQRHGTPRDITKVQPATLVASLGLGSPVEKAVDIVVGGPPCPAYTRVGRAKLREIGKHPEAHLLDARAKLYERYLAYVRDLQPVALVMENVPDVLNFGGRNLGEIISAELETLGYVCRYTLLNAASYGVPQMRERFFLIGVRKEAEAEIVFPSPTHTVDFPVGYTGSRSVALKHVIGMGNDMRRYRPPPAASKHLPPAVSVRDAIGDLPCANGRAFKRSAQYLDGTLPAAPAGTTPFVAIMRGWPGFAATATLRDHVTRALSERDFRLFARMNGGDDYPAAIRLAEKLFMQRLATIKAPPGKHTTAWRTLRAGYVPPYDVTKFPNRWRKMEADAPARTLMAHLGKDGYSHIHYDNAQARTITVREAARLQSFPDGFVFKGTMNPAFRQIGNAVPPLLAFAVAQAVRQALGLNCGADEGSLERARQSSGVA